VTACHQQQVIALFLQLDHQHHQNHYNKGIRDNRQKHQGKHEEKQDKTNKARVLFGYVPAIH